MIEGPSFPDSATLAGSNASMRPFVTALAGQPVTRHLAHLDELLRLAQEAKRRPRKRLSWAELVLRAFGIHPLECPKCGGRMRIVDIVTERELVEKILEQLGLPFERPEFSPVYEPGTGKLLYDEKLDLLIEVECERCSRFVEDFDSPHQDHRVDDPFPELIDSPHPDEYVDEDFGFDIDQTTNW